MDTKTDRAIADATEEVSLVRGGPFYNAQQALRLIRLNEWNLGRRIMMRTAVTWLPLVLLTALLNPVGLGSLLRDYRVYSRLLIAIPVLLIGGSARCFRTSAKPASWSCRIWRTWIT